MRVFAKRKLLWIAALCVVLFVVVCGVLYTVRLLLPREDRAMLDVSLGLMQGRTIEGVTAEYGPPVRTDKFKSWDVHWVLAEDYLDYRWLLVRVRNGKIVEAKVTSD